MAKKVAQIVKLQIPGGAATPAPPVGPALGGAGINIPEFCKAFNERTQSNAGTIIPVEISVFEDRSFTFIATPSPPPSRPQLRLIGRRRRAMGANRQVSIRSTRRLGTRSARTWWPSLPTAFGT